MSRYFKEPDYELELPDFPTDNPSPGTTVINPGI